MSIHERKMAAVPGGGSKVKCFFLRGGVGRGGSRASLC